MRLAISPVLHVERVGAILCIEEGREGGRKGGREEGRREGMEGRKEGSIIMTAFLFHIILCSSQRLTERGVVASLSKRAYVPGLNERGEGYNYGEVLHSGHFDRINFSHFGYLSESENLTLYQTVAPYGIMAVGAVVLAVSSMKYLGDILIVVRIVQ